MRLEGSTYRTIQFSKNGGMTRCFPFGQTVKTDSKERFFNLTPVKGLSTLPNFGRLCQKVSFKKLTFLGAVYCPVVEGAQKVSKPVMSAIAFFSFVAFFFN